MSPQTSVKDSRCLALTMKFKDSLLVSEDPLSVVAQLADVLGVEEKVAVLWRLPGAGAEQLVDHALVSALIG